MVRTTRSHAQTEKEPKHTDTLQYNQPDTESKDNTMEQNTANDTKNGTTDSTAVNTTVSDSATNSEKQDNNNINTQPNTHDQTKIFSALGIQQHGMYKYILLMSYTSNSNMQFFIVNRT
jgi:hypothetical protein